MARIPVSGVNDEAWTAVGTDVREVITGLDVDGAGRVFFLKQLQITNEHASAAGVAEIYDSDEDTGPTAGLQRGVFYVPPNESVIVDFGEPGLKFVTNVVGGISAGTVAANGGVRGSGYLV